MARLALIVLSAVGMLAATLTSLEAADIDKVHAVDQTFAGVACDGPEAQTFDGVWLGHFSGGFSHDLGDGGPIALDWRDEKLCFPSLKTCRVHVAEMRRDFHRPEGYFTCLPIR